MDTKYCENLKQLIDESAHLFQLDDMSYASFVARWGYKSKVSVSLAGGVREGGSWEIEKREEKIE